MRKVLITLAVLVVLILARMCFYTVDASEYAYVTVLGRHVATHDGGGAGAGLHIGWPWPIQAGQRLDRRLQSFDLRPSEILTRDPQGKTIDKNLLIEAYHCWRIADADAVDRFIKKLGTADRVRFILEERIRSQLGAILGQMK